MASEKEEFAVLERMERSENLLRTQYEKLRTEYANEFIAIDNGKILANDSNLAKLQAELSKHKKIDLALVVIQFIPKKGLEILL